ASRPVWIAAAYGGGCRQIPRTHHDGRGINRRRLQAIDKIGLEQTADDRPRRLLIQGRPCALANSVASARQSVGIFPIRPEWCARLAPQRVILLGQCWQPDAVPLVCVLCEQAPGEIILVPARHDQYDSAAWLQPCGEVEAVPVPDALAHQRAV